MSEGEWESLVTDERPEIMPITVRTQAQAKVYAKIDARLYMLGPEGHTMRKKLGITPKITWEITENEKGTFDINFTVGSKPYKPRKTK